MKSEACEIKRFVTYSALGVVISIVAFFGLLAFYSSMGDGGNFNTLWEGEKSHDIANIYGAILGIVIAFVGAWVAIVLAQRSVTTSNIQARMEAIRMLDEKMDRVRQNFYGLANDVCMFCITVYAINQQLIDGYNQRLESIRNDEELTEAEQLDKIIQLSKQIAPELSLAKLEESALRVVNSFAQIAEDDFSSDIWAKSCEEIDKTEKTKEKPVANFRDIQSLMFFFRNAVFNDLPTSKEDSVLKLFTVRIRAYRYSKQTSELSVAGALMDSTPVVIGGVAGTAGEFTLIGILKRLPAEDIVEKIITTEKTYGKDNPFVHEYLQHWKFAPSNYLSESFRRQVSK